MISYSDFVFCNKDEALAGATYLKEDLGISDTSDLKLIARAIAGYKKVNKQRPRVMVITNSD